MRNRVRQWQLCQEQLVFYGNDIGEHKNVH